MSLVLWIANKNYSSWSLRPWLLLKHLDIAFEERLVPFSHAGGNPEFVRFSPTAKVPVLEQGATRVWESLAIVEYLAEQHASIWPAVREARAWARSAVAEMHAGFHVMRSRCPMNCALQLAIPSLGDDLAHELERLDALWCEGLRRFAGPFLAGSRFTAVDAFFAPMVLRCDGYSLQAHLSAPARDYMDRILGLAAMQQWRCDALSEAPEPGHEADSLASGRLLRDLRQG